MSRAERLHGGQLVGAGAQAQLAADGTTPIGSGSATSEPSQDHATGSEPQPVQNLIALSWIPSDLLD